jgi:hypothetical protein
MGIFSIVLVLVLSLGGFAIAESSSEEQPQIVEQIEPSCGQGSCGQGNCDGSCGGNCGVKSCGCGK